eukprot:m.114177 g.114177  ORF g.114177 m.114177 type:complete len:128 (+) comp13043_c0_seq3:1609-1992(+)
MTFADAEGTTTKAAGTLLWMAPEVFRGDLDYSAAVDVFSFGVVLYELATREAPWAELRAADSEPEFFEALNRALQTGQRPDVPPEIVTRFPQFVGIMKGCWAGDPAERPKFSVVATELAACLRGEVA